MSSRDRVSTEIMRMMLTIILIYNCLVKWPSNKGVSKELLRMTIRSD